MATEPIRCVIMATLVGVTERWHDRGTGTFFCPACGSERDYRHRQGRNWFRLIVPLVPRDVVGDIYECQTCHREYDEHVITAPATSDLATRVQRLTRAGVVTAILDDDPYAEAPRRVAVSVITGTGLRHYSTADLDVDLRSMDVSDLTGLAGRSTVGMDHPARERLVIDIGHVAIADGTLSDANRSMLDELGRALELTPGTVHRLLSRLDTEAANIAAFSGHDAGDGAGPT